MADGGGVEFFVQFLPVRVNGGVHVGGQGFGGENDVGKTGVRLPGGDQVLQAVFEKAGLGAG